ncbi:MAG: hypothetical protein KAI79_13930 [Bacteroidales bacterium]|nr:hypothetical protein [Bacteroidales bacterium]
MKINKKLSIIFSLIVIIAFQSCNSLDEVGYSLLPEDDKINIEYSDSTILNVKNVF